MSGTVELAGDTLRSSNLVRKLLKRRSRGKREEERLRRDAKDLGWDYFDRSRAKSHSWEADRVEGVKATLTVLNMISQEYGVQ